MPPAALLPAVPVAHRVPPLGNGPGGFRSRGGWARRLLLFQLAGVVVLYLGGTGAGYLFFRYVRKNEHVGWLDVALLRWREVRRGMAAQQFAQAQTAWDTGSYQVAFLAFNFGVNNDPDNIPGRLQAARFLQTVGSVAMALTTLEAGLARAPDHPELIERTFELLLGTGRERRALELLQQRPAAAANGPAGLRLRAYELEARLNLGEIAAARAFLERHPELATAERAQPVVARLQWESKERLRAIALLSGHVQGRPATLAPYAQLAQWQLTAGVPDEAVRTAELAVTRFPDDTAAHVLLLEALAVRSGRGREWVAALEAFMREQGSRPEALPQLAALAGRRGWLDLARSLYELAALRQTHLGPFALACSDALMRSSRLREAGEVLAQLEAQAPEAAGSLLSQLRTRQVMVAAGLGDAAAVRDYARRLATAVRHDAGARELLRRIFQQAGVTAAVAELADRAPAPGPPARKKDRAT